MQCLGFRFVVGKTVFWLKWHLHLRKAMSFYFFFCRCVYRCLPCVAPAVCVAECNYGCCVEQFASVSSSRSSGVQLEEQWLCSRTDEQHNTEIWTKYRSLIWALITEEEVFCFKFVFLCFKQNSEQYLNWNVTYIDGRKIIFSYKMLPKADEAYLKFQKHVIRYSNSQSTVHITRWQLLLSVVHSVNTMLLTAV
jgi:hypothetical protein